MWAYFINHKDGVQHSGLKTTVLCKLLQPIFLG